jgi:hypothetical protein
MPPQPWTSPGIDGEILSQRAAIELGREIFGPLLISTS